jgi:CheY-like chemotaxis protein
VTTTLLAVDDSVTMRRVLEITFAGENFKTVLASNAEEAMKLAGADRPMLAILDHTLPDMSGYDLCRELKAAAPNVAVIILASKQSPYDKTRGSANGVDDFMDKPFDTQKLLDKVSQVLSQPRATVAGAAAAPAAPAAAVAPAAPAHGALPVAAARPRSQTLSYGSPGGSPTPVPQSVGVSRTLTGTPAPAPVATPRPAAAAAAPRMAAQAAAPAAAAPAPAAAAVAAAVASAGNGQLGGKLAAMGLTPSQVEGVLALSREVVEKVVWEVVPVLAETLIKEELRRLTSE